jgi:replicative DNA helicase
MNNDFLATQDADFTTLKEVILPLLLNSGYLVDANAQGIATGFDKIDALTNGFQVGEVCVVASKPGSGKTAFLLSLLFNIASKSGKTVGVFSPERSAAKMFHRLIETQTGHSIKKIMTGDLSDSEKERINSMLYSLSQSDVLADDVQYLTKDYFYRRCKQLKSKYNTDIAFVDGFELLSCEALSDVESNIEEQHRVLSDIKEIAVELGMPIVVFSHLLNTNKLNGNILPGPQHVHSFVSDIADSIMLVHRSKIGESAKIIICKHSKITQTAVIELKFIESIDKFVDVNS